MTTIMSIAVWVVLGWLTLCIVATGSWCVLVEVYQRRANKVSGSSRPGSARPASHESERPVPAARTTLAAHQRRAARTPHLKIVP